MAELKLASSADDILGTDDLKTEDVEIPEWGMTVRVRGLTAGQRDKFDESLQMRGGKSSLEHIRAKLLVWSCIKEDGSLVFNEKHVERLSQKSAAAVERLFNVAQRLSGMSNADVEELVKNFFLGPSDDSSSD